MRHHQVRAQTSDRETTSKAEYSGLMPHYEEYMSRKGRRSRDRRQRINERVQGLSAVSHRSTHLPGSEEQNQ